MVATGFMETGYPYPKNKSKVYRRDEMVRRQGTA